MKNFLLLLGLFTVNSLLFAQKGKVSSAISFKESGKLDKAWEAIQEAVNPANPKSEKSINWPESWEAKGEVLEAIYKSKDENYKKLVENPLEEAYKSFMKAIELDPKGGSPTLKIKLLSGFIPVLSNAAIEAFQAQKFEQSRDYFEKVLNIEATPMFKTDNMVDTAIMYNIGLASMNAKQYDQAIKYFKRTAQYGFNPGSSYSQIISAYQLKGDTLTSVSIMKEAFNKYPEDQSILVHLINYYLTTGKTEDAIVHLDKAIAKDKDNPSFYLAKGKALDKMGKQDDAIKEYEAAIRVKADYAEAYYNIGVIYFNRGVKQVDIANAVPTSEQAKFESEKKKSEVEFAKAVPYLEKAVEYNPNDIYIKDQLKNLYYRLQMKNKFEKLSK
jgi:tetratricopeptide (TPR) repeat protein